LLQPAGEAIKYLICTGCEQIRARRGLSSFYISASVMWEQNAMSVTCVFTGTGTFANIEYCRFLVWKYEGKRQLYRPGLRWKDLFYIEVVRVWNDVCNGGT
jgi:hypothetical protein